MDEDAIKSCGIHMAFFLLEFLDHRPTVSANHYCTKLHHQKKANQDSPQYHTAHITTEFQQQFHWACHLPHSLNFGTNEEILQTWDEAKMIFVPVTHCLFDSLH
jgi:hypothetical protein